MLFATPDFGTAAAGMGCVVVAWGVVFVGVLLGLAKARKWLKAGKPGRSIVLFLVCGLAPLSCCLGPSLLVRVCYGNFPIGAYPTGKVMKGMTADEVVAVLGTPHERSQREAGELWYYWIDAFSIQWFGVGFDRNGRVTSTFGN